MSSYQLNMEVIPKSNLHTVIIPIHPIQHIPIGMEQVMETAQFLEIFPYQEIKSLGEINYLTLAISNPLEITHNSIIRDGFDL